MELVRKPVTPDQRAVPPKPFTVHARVVRKRAKRTEETVPRPRFVKLLFTDLEKVRELWDAFVSLHSLSPVLRNSRQGKVKCCHLSVSPFLVIEGEGDTWDKARLRALWQALLRLDADLCVAWRRGHPQEVQKLEL